MNVGKGPRWGVTSKGDVAGHEPLEVSMERAVSEIAAAHGRDQNIQHSLRILLVLLIGLVPDDQGPLGCGPAEATNRSPIHKHLDALNTNQQFKPTSAQLRSNISQTEILPISMWCIQKPYDMVRY